ncbi:ankyrin repeat domain-containing protein [Candidatus Synechococcus spongiarum]|uniref:ankyrin repeat domain-containing protein n=1 Tax=Candidatus Synechococcus spongiarum TaxID=431041 RepID=UPI0015D66A4F|nr:ankyrin repeat domain-containing protein [Candidatus Synechococcus spongiarum]
MQAGSKMTALTDAAQKGDTTVVRAFIAAGADLNSKDAEATPLHHAARRGHTDIAKLLIDAGADVNAHGSTGSLGLDSTGGYLRASYLKDTPLHSAARGGHLDIAKALTAAGADPNAQNYYKRTPLHYAAARSDVGVGKILVYSGAHINSKDINQNNPMDLAYKDVCDKYFSEYDRDLNNDKTVSSSDSIDKFKTFRTEVAKAFLEASDRAKVSNKESKIPTDPATKKNPTEAVKVSVDTVGDLNTTDADGRTALHVAAKRGQTEIVKALIEAGANVDAKDAEGDTALHIVAKKGQADVARALIEAGANPNAKDDDRNTPLHIAVKKGQIDITRALLKAGANLGAKDDNDDTPLHAAAKRGQAEVLKILIEAGANLNAKDDNDNTPLHIAIKRDQNDVVKILIEAGANLNAKDDNGNTPLHIAIKKGQNDVVKALIEADASIDTTNKNGLTPLDIAETMENLNLIQILGAQLSTEIKYIADSSRTHSDSTIIFTALFTALGYLAKVDGKICSQEIEFVTSLMDEMKLAPERRRQAENLFRLGKQKLDVDLDNLMTDLQNSCNANPELLNVFVMSLVQFAYSDKDFSRQEKLSIGRIAAQLNLSQADIDSIEAAVRTQFRPMNASLDLQEAYKIIGISPATTASNDEIKKVYRNLMKLYHPDTFKSKNLSEDMLRLFEKRTQVFTIAYEKIRKVRSF